MNNNIITDDEMSTFKSLSLKQVCDSLGLYLIGTSAGTYNMQDVGRMVFGAENYSFTVSLIHRVYNFSGQNSGRYKKGCAFEKKYGYQVTTADTIAFVQTYPNGCAGTSFTFEQFLLSRVANKNKQADSSKAAKKNMQVTQSKVVNKNMQANQFQTPNYQNTYTQPSQNLHPEADNQFNTSSHSGEGIINIIASWAMVLGIIALIIMFITGNLFRHGIVSMIILGITGFGIYAIFFRKR